MAEKMKIIPLGGLNEVGKNMTVYEHGGEIIVVDCGMGFPDGDMYGIDLVIPDATYLVKNRGRIRGLFITHGHEDHIGAIPYILRQVNMPVYCTRLTAGLIKLKLEEHGLLKQTKLITVEAGEMIRVGKFYVEFIHVNHSIADSVAFAIHTSMGVLVHTGDFKIDSTPIDGEVIDLGRFGELGREGVLALLADSTNVERPGYTMSERIVGKTFDRLFTGCKQRIIVTTFASNVHRIQQVIDAAAACGRKVAVTGRSMENIMRVATELGYMNLPKNTVMDINKVKTMPLDKQVLVTTGSQGEEMSALYRMAFSQHRQIDVGPGDRVIISASAIPGNEKTIGRVIDELFRKGVDVIYDKSDPLHGGFRRRVGTLQILHPDPLPARIQHVFFRIGHQVEIAVLHLRPVEMPVPGIAHVPGFRILDGEEGIPLCDGKVKVRAGLLKGPRLKGGIGSGHLRAGSRLQVGHRLLRFLDVILDQLGKSHFLRLEAGIVGVGQVVCDDA